MSNTETIINKNMNNKEIIMNNLEQAKVLVHDALIKLKLENSDEKQVNFETNPSLAYAFDMLDNLMRKMEKIIYQQD